MSDVLRNDTHAEMVGIDDIDTESKISHDETHKNRSMWSPYSGEEAESSRAYFDEARDIRKNGLRQVGLMDLGDYLVLFLEHQYLAGDVKKGVQDLYACLGEVVNFSFVDIQVTPSEFHWIERVCGRIFSKVGSPAHYKVMSRDSILHDLHSIVVFHSVAKNHDRLTEILDLKRTPVAGPWNNASASILVPTEVFNDKKDQGQVNQGPFTEWQLPEMASKIRSRPYLPPPFWDKPDIPQDLPGFSSPLLNDSEWQWHNGTGPEEKKNIVHLIFNDLFNVSLIAEDVTDNRKIPELCSDFPEFTLVRQLRNLKNNNRAVCSNLFHCKTFKDIEELKLRVENFVTLFELPADESGPVKIKDVDRVREVLDTYFIISADPSSRMKATELMDTVSQMIDLGCCDNAFRKRLSGYFIECGLQKKRLRDGYYYWGIRRKDVQDDTAELPGSIEDIEEKRRAELQDHRSAVEKAADRAHADVLTADIKGIMNEFKEE